MHTLKVVIVGETKVGKSCILSRFVQGSFDASMPATIGAAFLTKVITTSEGPMRLQLWDTAGQEKFRSLAPMYYRSANVAVLVYDVTSKSSLESLEDWSAEIADKAPPGIKLVVIGNKIDMESERVISTQAGKDAAAAMNAALFGETSALTGVGINDIFAKIAEFDTMQDAVYEKPSDWKPTDNESGGCSC
ncbi:small GTP-binding protein, putative [Trichomonas vaginalis G3]|uniref:Small GTP-binding protein, putative n=2 Tax=Trichomonas vaginalis TaxID=5722 RepID=A0A8U0WPL2_TRIV3|nr:small Rab GTPase RabC5 [Trichomonas vaginalis G3]AAY83820.1 small Rab GTPase RabC5 [Trichomonas vaginalis]EAY02802.1 small GTP-binding protein, putative [Trichomonas vaginalis G3]KAI5537568.1 small Rab GTPase RabC5 [Trichomonas vaginalis G3]|eukprot:XP_001315025.1 small GTP-binding protein [Trichomonas vaginalis G3]